MGRKSPVQGNHLLDQLCGVRIRFAPPEDIGGNHSRGSGSRLKAEGYKNPFSGLSGLLSRIAYIQCALEIETQVCAAGIQADDVVIGSGGYQLGRVGGRLFSIGTLGPLPRHTPEQDGASAKECLSASPNPLRKPQPTSASNARPTQSAST